MLLSTLLLLSITDVTNVVSSASSLSFFESIVSDDISDYDYCNAPLPQQTTPPSDDWQLQRVVVTTRHGSRAPCNVLPFDDANYYCPPEDSSILTNQGQKVILLLLKTFKS
jgi:hypothetical protein